MMEEGAGSSQPSFHYGQKPGLTSGSICPHDYIISHDKRLPGCTRQATDLNLKHKFSE